MRELLPHLFGLGQLCDVLWPKSVAGATHPGVEDSRVLAACVLPSRSLESTPGSSLRWKDRKVREVQQPPQTQLSLGPRQPPPHAAAWASRLSAAQPAPGTTAHDKPCRSSYVLKWIAAQQEIMETMKYIPAFLFILAKALHLLINILGSINIEIFIYWGSILQFI